jgi:hypothetical protein
MPIGEAMRRYKNVIISGDFNATSMSWDGIKTGKRGRMLSEVQDRNQLTGKYQEEFPRYYGR